MHPHLSGRLAAVVALFVVDLVLSPVQAAVQPEFFPRLESATYLGGIGRENVTAVGFDARSPSE